jgi:hypothetical protein
VAIPFKSLRYVAGKDKLWGAHLATYQALNNELDMWMPISRDNSSWLAQEGHLSGLKGSRAHARIDSQFDDLGNGQTQGDSQSRSGRRRHA